MMASAMEQKQSKEEHGELRWVAAILNRVDRDDG